MTRCGWNGQLVLSLKQLQEWVTALFQLLSIRSEFDWLLIAILPVIFLCRYAVMGGFHITGLSFVHSHSSPHVDFLFSAIGRGRISMLHSFQTIRMGHFPDDNKVSKTFFPPQSSDEANLI